MDRYHLINMNTKIIKNNKNFKYTQSGFTLVELLVATAIFSVVMVVSLGALLVTMSSANNVRALNKAMDNVNFTMEGMTRSLRMGKNYWGGNNSIEFDFNDGSGVKHISYSFVDNNIERCINFDCQNMVASNVSIEKLNFTVDNSGQPSVYITVKGAVTIKGSKSSFSLQTMASQRTLE